MWFEQSKEKKDYKKTNGCNRKDKNSEVKRNRQRDEKDSHSGNSEAIEVKKVANIHMFKAKMIVKGMK